MNLQVGDIVRQRGAEEGDLLRVTGLYEGCDEVVVEEYPEALGSFDALGFDLELVERPAPTTPKRLDAIVDKVLSYRPRQRP